MNKLFYTENPVMAFLGRLTNFMVLSVIWWLCCIPVITVIPATCSLYYVTLKLAKKEEVPIIKTFFRGFKMNLKQGIILFFIFAAIGIVFFVDYVAFSTMDTMINSIASTLFVVLIVCLLSTILYTCALQAQFNNSIGGTLKNAFLLSVQKLKDTIVILFVHFLPVIFGLVFSNIFMKALPAVIVLAPAGIAYVCSARFVKIFAPLIPAPETPEP